MALSNYGVLKGRPIDRRLGSGSRPHYQVHVVDDETDYRIAINVKSTLSPSELLFIVDENLQHPITDGLEDVALGFTDIARRSGGQALDYIRGNLFDPSHMVPLPHDLPGQDNDLNEKIDRLIQRAMGDEDALLYAFGERWGPENKKDPYFGFRPGNGIHNIHMNQGNAPQFAGDNGVWQDGALLIHFPDADQWVGVFLAFQSQSWHTDDQTGNAIISTDSMGARVHIIAALVNPLDHDPGHETVTLLNVGTTPVDLSGWSLADKNKRREPLQGIVITPGDTIRIRLTGNQAQLSNQGGIISLLDPAGVKAHGVSYTKSQAQRQGWSLHF
jgi:uncharacterized protein YukJ